MARTIQEVNNEILSNIASDPVLGSQLTSTSQTAKFRLWSYIVATSVAFFEQLMDLFIANVESKLTLIAPNTPQWIQYQVLNWQYNHQAVYQSDSTKDNFGFWYYPTIDTTARIVTQCSVTTLPNRSVAIKCAKSGVALSVGEKAQLTSYISEAVAPVGVFFSVTSLNGDLLTFTAQVHYDGQYSNIIQTNVETAISNYLNTLQFDGKMYINKIIDAVIAVQGVVNFTITTLTNTDANAIVTPLITSSTWVQNSLNPLSGYFQTSTFNITYTAV